MEKETSPQPLAHIVDDDEAIRDSLSWLLESRGVACTAWTSAEAFLSHFEAHPTKVDGALILDIRMEGMTGLELFARLRQRNCGNPVIFLTGHGDVPMAVGALKQGAFDFFEKPFNDNDLVNRVIEAIEANRQRRQTLAGADALRDALAQLTERERQVMELVLAGKLNKVIADELNISMRTVEVHRSHLFEKMGVRSAVELAQRLKELG